MRPLPWRQQVQHVFQWPAQLHAAWRHHDRAVDQDRVREHGIKQGFIACFLQGERGTDTLAGGTGGDVLWGGQGNDPLDGGADSDLLLEVGFDQAEAVMALLADFADVQAYEDYQHIPRMIEARKHV